LSYHDLRSTADIEQRFSYHPASSPERQAQHEAVRAACKRLAHALDRIVPPGRHKALALTAVEESMHWANAAVACQVEPIHQEMTTGHRI
jgi:ketosteroid isomerase-like protein